MDHCEWVIVDRGQAGHRLPHTVRFFVTDSMGGHLGTADARLGLRGPVWNIYVIVTLALACGIARTVYLQPISEGKVTRVGAGPHAEEAPSLRGVMGRGVRARLLPLYPRMPPRVHPRGLPEPIGREEVPELLLGGRRRTLDKEALPRAREHASLGQHGHLVAFRWRLVPRIPVKLLQRLLRRRSKRDVLFAG